MVVDDDFDWGEERPLRRRWSKTVVYELHPAGFTRLHPLVPEHLRGTYAALGHPAVTDYLTDLGVTAVELLPVHQFATEPEVAARGLTNFWGYNPLGFFAPHGAYSSAGTRGEQVREFKQMVRDLHAAGIEVILDVVYNHTAESDASGPTLFLRGYGDAAAYRRAADGGYADFTGCGNTVDVTHPQTLRMVLDSLRYWVTEMHVDGFRFDLASALARNSHGVDLRGPFLSAIGQDPVLREVKLVAEPWDLSADGYLVGSFPPPWCEWNDRFRDAVRDFWRGHGDLSELATRLSGSSDLYADDGRHAFNSVNFVTSHDGFTMRDLTTYETKHNEANGEQNRDGTDNNRSWNCGVEGETDDEAVNALRRRQTANLMSTLLVSTGVPMIVAGDERGRTQGGNNNAYAQDNPTSWLDWTPRPEWEPLRQLTRTLLRLRAEHPVLRQRHFFSGQPLSDNGAKDLTWLHPSGREMTHADWHAADAVTLGTLLNGGRLRGRGPRGEPLQDASYAIWLHGGADDIEVRLPPEIGSWRQVAATGPVEPGESEQSLRLPGRCVAVLEVDWAPRDEVRE